MTSSSAAQVTIKQFLEAGVHFGHQTRRWNPKMAKFIFGERNDIYIIDLKKTMKMFRDACEFAKTTSATGAEVLFVGTKKQAQDTIKLEAERAGMPYVNHRWLGGMLTNYTTISKGVKRLQLLEKMEQDGSLALRSKKEAARLMKEKDKLNKNLGGVKNMKGLPAAVYIVDPHTEQIAVQEANRLGIPIIAITDTNCDPDPIQWIVPANDDAIRSVQLITSRIADSVLEGRLELQKQISDLTGVPMEGVPATTEPTDAVKESAVPLVLDITEKEFKPGELEGLTDDKLEVPDLLDVEELLKDDKFEEIEDEFKE